jgi:hypothetical protein
VCDGEDNYKYVGKEERAQGKRGSSACKPYSVLSRPPVHEADRKCLIHFSACQAQRSARRVEKTSEATS